VTLVWLVALPFVLVHIAVGFIAAAPFRILLWRTENLGGTESARMRF